MTQLVERIAAQPVGLAETPYEAPRFDINLKQAEIGQGFYNIHDLAEASSELAQYRAETIVIAAADIEKGAWYFQGAKN